MQSDSYTRKAYKEIYFSNSDVSFEFFYKNMTNLLVDLISEQNIYRANRKIFSFIGNFLYAVDTDDNREKVQENWLKIYKGIEHDEELKRLIKLDQQEIDITVPYIRKYYHYFIEQIKVLSYFLASLDRTYMPTTDLSKSLFKWKNYLQFFNGYITFKQLVTDNMSSFSIIKYQQPINSILIFYYAFNQYVTYETKVVIENSLSKLIDFIMDKDYIKLVNKEYKTSRDQELLSNIKWKINKFLLEIYNRINNEHSIYNIIPKVQKKVYVDATNI